jgi:hypothetical protein
MSVTVVVPQNIEFELIKSEFFDDSLIELPILSNVYKIEYLKD